MVHETVYDLTFIIMPEEIHISIAFSRVLYYIADKSGS